MGFAVIIVEAHILEGSERGSGYKGVALGALVRESDVGLGGEYVLLSVLQAVSKN